MHFRSAFVDFGLKPLLFLSVSLVTGGCAALAPVSALIGGPHGGSPGLEVHDQTTVDLGKDNFSMIRTNVVGRSRGFSLLGFITIYPATLTKAMNRMYAAGHMLPGEPQSVAHMIIEHSSSYFILFGIPKVEVRADIVQFRPEKKSPGPVAVGAPAGASQTPATLSLAKRTSQPERAPPR